MNTTGRGDELPRLDGVETSRGFLDELPKGLYALAHLMFLGVGVWLWARANDSALPYSEALRCMRPRRWDS